MKVKILDEDYSDGWLKVKESYIRKPELFDVVYACRMGNSDIASKEGSLFAGLGLIHITGKYNYYILSELWNDDPENDGNDKFFYKMKDDDGHYEELINNYDVAVKASMYYWKLQNINKYCDTNNYTKVNELVNGGQTDDKKRKTLTDKISVELNNAKQ